VARLAFGHARVDASIGAKEDMKMNPRVKLLKELVNSELYVVDAVAVADAVLLRSMTCHMLPDVAFRGTPRPEPEVRSFRPHRGVKSFRLTRTERRPLHRGTRALSLTA
jgi:hypothetical protein